MFGINFTELMVIGVVALIVLGPERLPRVAKTIGVLLGRAQRYVHDIKKDIHQEIELTELKKIREEVEDGARSLQTTLLTNATDLESMVRQTADDVKTPLEQVKADLERIQKEGEASMAVSEVPPALAENVRPEIPMPVVGSESDAFESAPETMVKPEAHPDTK